MSDMDGWGGQIPALPEGRIAQEIDRLRKRVRALEIREGAVVRATTAQETAETAQSAAADASWLAGQASAEATAAATAAADAHNEAIAAAADALAAAGLADSKGKVIIQSAEPDVADRLPQNLWIDTTGGANTPKRWTGSAWVAVTDQVAVDAANAAAAAHAAANAAQSTANSAVTAASAAQATANGKNQVTYSAASPSGVGTREGDLWFQYAAGIVIGQWRWDGAAWVAMTIDSAVIANLDAGKITTGILDAARLGARTITTELLALGVLTMNLIANPGFEDMGVMPPVPGSSPEQVPGWAMDFGASGRTDAFRWAQGANIRSGNGCAIAWSGTAATNGMVLRSAWAEVVPGRTYRISAWVKNVHQNCAVRLSVAHAVNAGGSPTTVILTTQTPTVVQGYVELAATWTCPAGRTVARVEVSNRNTATSPATARAVAIDDVQIIEVGAVGLEVTPSGLRFWDEAGETAAEWDGLALVTDTVTARTGLRANSLPSTTSAANARLQADSGGTLHLMVVTSTARNKRDIAALPPGAAEAVLALTGVTWHEDGSEARVAGLVAEDVAAVSAAHGGVLDPLVEVDETGAPTGVAYDRLAVYLLGVLRDLHERLTD